jgi:hypothetical protein
MDSTRSRARAASAVVAVVLAFAACSASPARGPVPNTDPPDFGPPNTPTCSLIPAATAVKNIDRTGGEVVFTDREHVLTVLRNGVSSQIQFRMVQHQRNFVLVRIAPDAHKFDRPAVLTLSYQGCVLQNGNPLRIYRFNPGEGVWDSLPSFHNPSDMTVSAAIGTLSDYAMGSN